MRLFVEDGLIADAANGQQILTLSSAVLVQVLGQPTRKHVAVVLVGRRDEHVSTLNACLNQGLSVEHVAVQDQHVEGLRVLHGPRIHVEKHDVVFLFLDEGLRQAEANATCTCNHHQHVITSGLRRACSRCRSRRPIGRLLPC